MADRGAAEPHRLPLRFRDLDWFGHVYHAEYLTLLDDARTHWFATTLELDDPAGYVLVHVEIDWLSPLTLEDAYVTVDVAVEKVGTSSLTLAETMRARDGRPVARSRSVTVRWDRMGSRTRPLTASERERAARRRYAG